MRSIVDELENQQKKEEEEEGEKMKGCETNKQTKRSRSRSGADGEMKRCGCETVRKRGVVVERGRGWIVT